MLIKQTFRFLFSITSMLVLLFSCNYTQNKNPISQGVSQELAIERKQAVHNVVYHLNINIPENLKQSITASMTIEMELLNVSADLILDFNESSNKIHAIRNEEQTVDYLFDSGHIIIPAKYLFRGKNKLDIQFDMGEESLNRNPDYLYSLFVPAKASSAFPCFDQPDMKAVYDLSLTVPLDWQAVSSGQLLEKFEQQQAMVFRFRETKPLSTYAFGFVAGKFQKQTKKINNHTFSFFYLPTPNYSQKNVEEVFSLHAGALSWMERYTEINYPFDKLDFIAIPSFQYSGMEHAGAIVYRSEKLFLEPTATLQQRYSRANVIAHETSHMWFGDLVTMKWFDDVWLKEIFANFFAAKITNPNFPQLDYDLLQLVQMYPKAYEVDRTAGANPIKQKLNNLNVAGSLYGNIIYYKAPIVLFHLEEIMGAKAMQDALQEYLQTYKYSNADWDDLITVFSRHTAFDLNQWSQLWVKTAGMPIIQSQLTYNNTKTITLQVSQMSSLKDTTIWPQQLNLFWCKNQQSENISFYLNQAQLKRILPKSSNPDFYLLNADGKAYGAFIFSEQSLEYLFSYYHKITHDNTRAIAIVNLYENFLHYRIHPDDYMLFLNRALLFEQNEPIEELILTQIQTLFWQFLNADQQLYFASLFEETIRRKAQNAKSKSQKRVYFNSMLNLFLTEAQKMRMYTIWEQQSDFYGLQLNTKDLMMLAFELAVRDEHAHTVLSIQQKRLEKHALMAEYQYIAQAVSPDKLVRDQFFDKIKQPENRTKEPWLKEALRYLHHPLRQTNSRKYIRVSLQMLPEIEATGSIFMPNVWLNTILKGHSSSKALFNVEYFLNEETQIEERFKNKILQSSDLLQRAVKMREKYQMDYKNEKILN